MSDYFDKKDKSDDKTKDDKVKNIEDEVDKKLKEFESKDDYNIEDISNNMPKPGFMEVKLNKGELTTVDDDGDDVKKPCTVMRVDDGEYINQKGDKVTIFDTIFKIDLHELFQGQISECANTVMPNLIQEAESIAIYEKEVREPKRRKEEFRYWWVILLLMIPIVITIAMSIHF